MALPITAPGATTATAITDDTRWRGLRSVAKEDVASACRPYPDQRASTCSCSGHSVSVECSKARVTLMAHAGYSSERRWSRPMMWLAQRQSQARALPRPTRRDACFSVHRPKGSHLRTDCLYQSAAINGVFDACCASASSVQLLWHARICLPRNLDRRANLLFFVRCGGSSQSGFADNRLCDPSSCRARGQCRAKQNVQCGK